MTGAPRRFKPSTATQMCGDTVAIPGTALSSHTRTEEIRKGPTAEMVIRTFGRRLWGCVRAVRLHGSNHGRLIYQFTAVCAISRHRARHAGRQKGFPVRVGGDTPRCCAAMETARTSHIGYSRSALSTRMRSLMRWLTPASKAMIPCSRVRSGRVRRPTCAYRCTPRISVALLRQTSAPQHRSGR